MRRGRLRMPCGTPFARRATVGLLGCLTLGCALPSWALAQQQPVAAPASVIDGPSPALAGPTDLGVSIARDGTGGAVYLKQAGGGDHVFVSRLAGGVFQPPVQVDTGLASPSSQPVIAAGNGGLLEVGFINGGQLFVAGAASSDAALGPPTVLAAGASNPAISMSNAGKAYLAFVVGDGGGTDVRAAFFWQGQWALEPSPLNRTPGDDAGAGAGRPAVVAAGDGVGIVAWGEAGGIYTRRVWGTAASTVDEQADGTLPGCTEASADQPGVGSGGDSSYAVVAFREQLSCSGQPSSRVLMNRLHGSAYDGLTPADGLTGGGDGADRPRIAVGEYGAGMVTSQRTGSHALLATALSDNGVAGSSAQVNDSNGSSAPIDVPAMAGLYTEFVAWQQDPGGAGPPEIRLRFAPGRDPLGPEVVLSSPTQGPTNAASGLAADGDSFGDAAVLWVQGSPSSPEIMAAQLYQAPGGVSVPKGRLYARTPSPRLSWTPPREPWGPVRYTLSIDGVPQEQTNATSVQPSTPLSDGPHTYQVTATNPAGQQSQSSSGTVFVDTTPPVAHVGLSGIKLISRRILARVSYRDLPPAGAAPHDASGVASVRLAWGDGTTLRLGLGQHRLTHVYTRPGRYTVTVLVRDKAGNTTRVTVRIKIRKPKPTPKPGKPHR